MLPVLQERALDFESFIIHRSSIFIYAFSLDGEYLISDFSDEVRGVGKGLVNTFIFVLLVEDDFIFVPATNYLTFAAVRRLLVD